MTAFIRATVLLRVYQSRFWFYDMLFYGCYNNHHLLLLYMLLQCRVRVKRISKNHIVNNLALSFLKSNSGEKILTCSYDVCIIKYGSPVHDSRINNFH